MVGGDDESPAGFTHCVDDGADSAVDRFDGVDRRVELARMTDHVGVGEIDEHEVVLLASNRRRGRVGHLRLAHLGLFVVRLHVARRGNHLPVLALEGLFAAAVEEVRDVRVLLGLGAAELRLVVTREDLGEDVGGRLFGIGNGQGKPLVVRRHADVGGERRGCALGPREVREGRVGESLRDFAGAVAPEVEEDGGVLSAIDASVITYDDRLDEFVALACDVRSADRLERGGRARSVGEHDRAPRTLDAIPTLVPVHRPVSPGDDANLSFASKSLEEHAHETLAALGRRVTPVEECMHDDRDARAGRGVDEREQMLERAVHAAVRNEPEQVKSPAS